MRRRIYPPVIVVTGSYAFCRAVAARGLGEHKLVAGEQAWRPEIEKRSVLLLSGGGALVALLIIGLTADVPLGDRVQDVFGYGGAHIDTADHGRTLFHSEVDITGVRQGLTYAQFNARRIANAVDGFSGFGCPESCAAHEDGFRWAAKHGVTEASKCIGRSWSEIEGCAAFVSLKNDPDYGGKRREN